MTMHLAPSLLSIGEYAGLQGRRVSARHASKERLAWHHDTARSDWVKELRGDVREQDVVHGGI
jgi:hypothetical protein